MVGEHGWDSRQAESFFPVHPSAGCVCSAVYGRLVGKPPVSLSETIHGRANSVLDYRLLNYSLTCYVVGDNEQKKQSTFLVASCTRSRENYTDMNGWLCRCCCHTRPSTSSAKDAGQRPASQPALLPSHRLHHIHERS